MGIDEDWHNPERRTMQRLSLHRLPNGEIEGMLLVINGREAPKEVRLPELEEIRHYELIWDSALEAPNETKILAAGSSSELAPASIQLFLAVTK